MQDKMTDWLLWNAINLIKDIAEQGGISHGGKIIEKLTQLKKQLEYPRSNTWIIAKRLVSIVKKLTKNNPVPYQLPPKGAKLNVKGMFMENLNLGKRIKLLRINAGIKQGQLADRLGVSANYISLLENGKKEPSLQFMKKLSNTLKVPLDLFFLPAGDDTPFFANGQAAKYRKLLSLFFQFYSEFLKSQKSAAIKTS